MVLVGHANCRDAPCVLESRVDADAVRLLRQRSAMPGRGHRPWKSLQSLLEFRSPTRQIATRGHGPQRRLRIDARIDAAAAVEPTLRVGVVKIVQDAGHLHALILVQVVFEDALGTGSLVEHQVLADQTAGVGKALRKAIAGGIEEQSSSLCTIGRQHHGTRRLKMLPLVAVEITNTRGAALRVGVDVKHVTTRSNLTKPGGFGLWNHGVERGGLGARLTAETHAEST